MPDGTGQQPAATPRATDTAITVSTDISTQVVQAQLAEMTRGWFGTATTPEVTAGGGGAGGYYNITSLDQLNGFITRWKLIRDKIEEFGQRLGSAKQDAQPPADNEPSRMQARAAQESLQKAIDHNLKNLDYAKDYIRKMEATRDSYLHAEEYNTGTIDNSDRS